MTINTWNTIIPESQALNNIPLTNGNYIFEHKIGSSAPTAGSWLGLIPRNFSGWSITRLEISVPYCDSSAAIRWQLGTFNYDTGVMNTGDSSFYAGEQFTLTPSGVAAVSLINGQNTGVAANFYTVGGFGGGSSFIRANTSDLLELTPPSDRFSNSSLGIGLVCTTAPATWNPTDSVPKKIIVSISLAARPRRSILS